jgi:hypothetical protein
MPDALQRNLVDFLPRQEKAAAESYAVAGETASAAADLPPTVTFSSVAPLANLKASTHSRFVLSTMDLSSGEVRITKRAMERSFFTNLTLDHYTQTPTAKPQSMMTNWHYKGRLNNNN